MNDFKQTIYWLIWNVPRGRCVTYGQLAAIAGRPRAARIVGGIAHSGPPDLPWHRLVMKGGRLPSRFPGGRNNQRQLLENEGVVLDDSDTIQSFLSVNWTVPAYLTIPLVVVLGQTASGKSSLAMKLATEFNGSIICADAWTVRKDMDIGTAKPTLADQKSITHYLLDVVDVNEEFSVARFQHLAHQALDKIYENKKLAFLVGGNGLYIDSIIYGYKFRTANTNKLLIKKLQLKTLKQLQNEIKPFKLELNNSDLNNKKRLISHLINKGNLAQSSFVLRPNTLLIGLSRNKRLLDSNVRIRAERMLNQGLIGEVKKLVDKYGWNNEAMKGVGYKEFKDFFENKIDKAQLVDNIINSNLRYAKKQKTWFKRNKNILWLEDETKATRIIRSFLSDKQV